MQTGFTDEPAPADIDLPRSAEGDHLREKAHTITTFNQMIEAVAETFDLHAIIGDDNGDEVEPVDEDKARSRKGK